MESDAPGDQRKRSQAGILRFLLAQAILRIGVVALGLFSFICLILLAVFSPLRPPNNVWGAGIFAVCLMTAGSALYLFGFPILIKLTDLSAWVAGIQPASHEVRFADSATFAGRIKILSQKLKPIGAILGLMFLMLVVLAKLQGR